MKRGYVCRSVGLHRIGWRATCSALANVEAVADGLAWLVGSEEDVTLDRTSSYHGPEIVLIEASTNKKKAALHSLARLGEANLRTLTSELDQRLDEHHVLHFRLELDRLVAGDVVLASGAGTNQIKAQAKIEVYPGQTPGEEAAACLEQALQVATTAR